MTVFRLATILFAVSLSITVSVAVQKPDEIAVSFSRPEHGWPSLSVPTHGQESQLRPNPQFSLDTLCPRHPRTL